jgi:hypothetical protein
MGDRNQSDGAIFGLDQDNITVESCTRGTHPGAEQRPVRRRLMLSMVSSVLSSLSLSQATDSKDSKDE